MRVRSACWRLALAFVAAAAAAAAAPAVHCAFDRAAGELSITSTDADSVREVRVATRGLEELETSATIRDPGPIYLPPAAGAPDPAQAELVFFFHDLAPTEGWELVAEFDPALRGTWKLNGRFSPAGGPVAARVVLPISELEAGENLLFVRAGGARPRRLYYRHAAAPVLRVPLTAPGGRVRVELVGDPSGRPIAVTTCAGAPARVVPAVVAAEPWADRDRLAAAALAVGRDLVRSRITRPGSLFRDGFPLVYDLERAAYRMPHWVWAWGPAIDLLLELRPLAARHDPALAAEFECVALAAARRSLTFAVHAPGTPPDGLASMRWEPARATPLGYVEYQTASDALFLAGWGWAPAYRVSHDEAFATGFRALAAATERLMHAYPVVPQDWVVEREQWTPHTLDESLFGVTGFRAWQELAPAAGWREQGSAYAASHVAHFGRDDGFLERAWLRADNRPLWDPDVKGHGWVVSGYLDAYRLAPDGGYLARARQVAAAVLACQRRDGAWAHGFHPPADADAVDDKATALWAWLLYRLEAETGEATYGAAARRALAWCLRHQVQSDDPGCDGAIVNVNGMAYIGRRPLTVLYTNTFFGLAVLEELRRAAPGERGRTRPLTAAAPDSHAIEPARP